MRALYRDKFKPQTTHLDCACPAYKPRGMADYRTIPPSSILLDLENPRLPAPQGQRDTFKTIAQTQARKLLALATDVVR
jgi:hypothetical protein